MHRVRGYTANSLKDFISVVGAYQSFHFVKYLYLDVCKALKNGDKTGLIQDLRWGEKKMILRIKKKSLFEI